MAFYKEIISELKNFFDLFIVCRGKKIEFFRKRGAKIGSNCELILKVKDFGSEPWLIEIGNNVTIGPNVSLITHDGSSRLFRHNFPDMNPIFGNKFSPIRIFDNCFIGANSIILPGVTIGSYSIIGAGSVVTKDVPSRSVVAGNPAKIIYTLDQYIEKYKKNMIPINSKKRLDLREELTLYFWKEKR